MSQRGFWNGMLAGGVIGALLGSMSRMTRSPGRQLEEVPEKLQVQARQAIRAVRHGVSDLIKRD